MDAESPNARELSLPQAFLLLATNDADGGAEITQPLLQAGVAGAILAELDLLGAIELQGKHVRVTGAPVPAEVQHHLELIRHKSRPHTPHRWVSILESRAEVHRIYEELAAQGVVRHVGEKRLGLFRITRYPEQDHAPKAALLKDIEAGLGSGTADARTTALIGLLHVTGLLEKLFADADHHRARDIANSHWPSHAVAEEIRMIALAEAEAAT
ncbi:GPP34 family phosphoprotein [Arthrobacter sp. OV608]|uniref:GOLPH3/VPS74 family protein n=1 Tax=Arthrobacter sp. OV608 TaxID=1882768 RepID=UPI0008D1136B|nr:GPP34 family phosphoprotein [Arthrobacter sp. OV608]SEQ92743.1 Golgi phosphoprotein 3 (GPP34) [Arthrobacter sp. OV608]